MMIAPVKEGIFGGYFISVIEILSSFLNHVDYVGNFFLVRRKLSALFSPDKFFIYQKISNYG